MITFPKLNDSANQLYGTSSVSSICGDQQITFSDQGQSPKYITALP